MQEIPRSSVRVLTSSCGHLSIYGKDLGAGDGKNLNGSVHPGRGFAGAIQGQRGEVVFLAQVCQKKVFCTMLGKSGDGR